MRHRPRNIAARLVVAAVLLIGCGGGGTRPGAARVPSAVPLPPDSRIDSVFVLESGGSMPDDTTVVVAAGQGRTVVLRRGPPDNGIFARLVVTPAATERRLTIRPRPGLYGLDILTDQGVTGRLSLSYAQHFLAPSGARARYGGDLGFERALMIVQAHPDGRVAFLRTTRPGSDLVSADLTGPGRYLVAAPRR